MWQIQKESIKARNFPEFASLRIFFFISKVCNSDCNAMEINTKVCNSNCTVSKLRKRRYYFVSSCHKSG